MLSSPPRAFARSTSLPTAWAAGSSPTISRISWSSTTGSLRPSEQRTNASPGIWRTGSGRSSASTTSGGHAERARDLVGLRVCRRGLLERRQPAIDELLDHRVVARDAEDLAPVHQVGAAVPNVCDLGAQGVEQDRDGRRARAAHRHLARPIRIDHARGGSTSSRADFRRTAPSLRGTVGGAVEDLSKIVASASSAALHAQPRDRPSHRRRRTGDRSASRGGRTRPR